MAIRVDGLTKSYGSVRAVDGIDFRVERGELFGVLGPNGAGKTTTLRALTGRIRPDDGTVRVLGCDPVAEPIETRRRVGIVPEGGSPPSFLTPREFLEFVGSVRNLDPEYVAERLELWADRLGFCSKLETLHTDLSRGQQQKVMLAQAFVHEPDAVLIDEPLANLDPIVQEQVKRFLVAYAADDNAVLVSTHNIDVAEAICSRVGIVADGRVVAERTLGGGNGNRNRTEDADGDANTETDTDATVADEPLLDVFLEHVGEEATRDMPSLERVEP